MEEVLHIFAHLNGIFMIFPIFSLVHIISLVISRWVSGLWQFCGSFVAALQFVQLVQVKILNIESPSSPNLFEPSTNNKHLGSEVGNTESLESPKSF